MTSNRKLSKRRPLPPCADAEEERMRERLPIILEAIRRKNGYRYEYLTLGFLYEVGFLFEQNLKKAAEHYSRISRIDWSKKRFAELVSKIYPEWLDFHSEQENSELFKRLIPHAHEGNRWAEIAVAYAYQYGVGVRRNLRQAIWWHLHYIDAEHLGLPKDIEQAYRKHCTKLGVPPAKQMFLGYFGKYYRRAEWIAMKRKYPNLVWMT